MIKKVSTKNMTHEEWVKERSKTIGGSDASAIVGMNPYASAYSLWAEKTGRTESFEGNLSTKIGTYLEEFVAKLFEEETGKKVRRENAIIYNDEYPFAHANIDRAIVGEDAGLEIKTTSALSMGKFKGGEYPSQYYVQCVHYLAITGKKKWYLAVLIGNNDFRTFEIERDEDEIKALMDAERDFFKCVEQDTVPIIDGSKATTEAIKEVFPEANADSCMLQGYESYLAQYVALSKQIKELDNLRNEAANKVKAYMGEVGRGESDGFRVSFGTQTRNTFDSKAFIKDHSDMDFDGYYKQSTCRVFKVTEKN